MSSMPWYLKNTNNVQKTAETFFNDKNTRQSHSSTIKDEKITSKNEERKHEENGKKKPLFPSRRLDSANKCTDEILFKNEKSYIENISLQGKTIGFNPTKDMNDTKIQSQTRGGPTRRTSSLDSLSAPASSSRRTQSTRPWQLAYISAVPPHCACV